MTLLASQLSHPFSDSFFLEPFWLLLFEHVNVLGRLLGVFFYSSVEFTSFHSLFTLSFHCIVYALTSLVNSTEYGYICRPQNLLTYYYYYY